MEARLPDEETDEHLAVFNALVSANASGKELMQVVCGVVEAADAIELRFTGRDEF